MKTALPLMLVLAAACGSPSAPVTPAPVEDAAAPPATTPSAAVAAADAGKAEAPKESKVDPTTGAPTEPEKDECTPVGVDFERRARPKLKECYAAGKKKDPNLEGSVKIKVTVDVKGKIKSVKVADKTLPDAVANCMLKAVKETPFPEVDKCWDATILLPITFPTPH